MDIEHVVQGNCLVVQWLGFHASSVGGMGSIPAWGTKIPHSPWCGQGKKRRRCGTYRQWNTTQEQNWVICRDVNGPRICQTEWYTSEREKQILYINTYMWNLAKQDRRTNLQARNRDKGVENLCGRGGWRGSGSGLNWEVEMDMYIATGKLLYSAGSSVWGFVVT